MRVIRQSYPAPTVADLMSRDPVRLSEQMPLREAARLLLRAGVGGAPVVDARGRCVGVLSAADVLRWVAGGGLLTPCPYQVTGRLLTGEDAVICTLAAGNCPWQMVRPATGGRHTVLCRYPGNSPPCLEG